MDFRERLRDEIAFSGLSNKEVAAKAGITIRSLVSYVSSQACIPSAEVAVRLAKVLNTSVEYLVTGENSKTSWENSNEESRKLLYVYKNLPEAQRKLLLAVAEDISKCLGH
jgi:transcriptional regulator with XRE-family HTH domain